jgi:hypothetical protein
MSNGVNGNWATCRCTAVTGEAGKINTPHYQIFKAFIGFNNQENIRVWQIPD